MSYQTGVGKRTAVGRLLFQHAARAGILALLVTPDAVVGLIEASDQISAVIG